MFNKATEKLNIGSQACYITLRKQKINTMVIFIKKIKTKEGINSLNLDKVRKDIPAGFEPLSEEPIISITANHVVIAFKCKLKVVAKAAANKKVVNKKPAGKKKPAPAKA